MTTWLLYSLALLGGASLIVGLGVVVGLVVWLARGLRSFRGHGPM